IPLAVFGPMRTRDYYVEYFQVTLAPGLGLGADDSRSNELTHVTSTDSQALVAALHNTIYPHRTNRPSDASMTARAISYLLGGLLTAATFWAAGRRGLLAGARVPLFWGALILNMLLLCPVCHLHYFSMALPLVMGLLAVAWEGTIRPRYDWRLLLLLTANIVVNALPNFQGLEMLRDLCVAMYMALVLWAIAVVLLRRSAKMADSETILPAAPGRAAA